VVGAGTLTWTFTSDLSSKSKHAFPLKHQNTQVAMQASLLAQWHFNTWKSSGIMASVAIPAILPGISRRDQGQPSAKLLRYAAVGKARQPSKRTGQPQAVPN